MGIEKKNFGSSKGEHSSSDDEVGVAPKRMKNRAKADKSRVISNLLTPRRTMIGIVRLTACLERIEGIAHVQASFVIEKHRKIA